MSRSMTVLGATLGLCIAFNSHAFTTAFEFSFAPTDWVGSKEEWRLAVNEGRTSGHEEITRQALNITRELLEENTRIDLSLHGRALLNDLKPHWRGTIGASSTNAIIKGNYCTDVPNEASAVFSLPTFWFGAEGAKKDWHNDALTQTLHFLRPHTRNGLASARSGCFDARKKIIQATLTAAREWTAGHKREAMFLIGHATHILQDSFAGPHTRRASRMENFNIRDLCYYGSAKQAELKRTGRENLACYHAAIDLAGDEIWIRNEEGASTARENFPEEPVKICGPQEQYVISEKSKRACMKSEARLARNATVRYLYLLATDIHAHRVGRLPYDANELRKLQSRLERELFEGSMDIKDLPDKMPHGVLRCGELRNGTDIPDVID